MSNLVKVLILAVGIVNLTIGYMGITIGPWNRKLMDWNPTVYKSVYVVSGIIVLLIGIAIVFGFTPAIVAR